MSNASYRGRIIVNDTDYTGSFVDPNPSGVATDDLNTVGIDGKIFNIAGSGGGGSNLIVDAQIYSLEEKQVGVWTDGKPLYQKTVSFPANTSQTFSVNLDVQNVEHIFLVPDGCYGNDGNWTIPYITGNNHLNNIGGFFDNLGEGNTATFEMRVGQESAPYNRGGVLTFRYTKTTDAVGSGGFQAYGFTPIIYSTEEREVGVWIDNKPLYQKTWILSNEVLVNSNGITISEIDASMIEHLIGCNGGYQSLSNTKSIPIMVWKYNNTWYYGSSINAYVDTITLLYTKTTDVAGSGSYNTLGVPTVHYTTDEQVIGTWIDGKPIYQKTVDTGALPNTTLKTVAHNISNISKIVKYEGIALDSTGADVRTMPYVGFNNWSIGLYVNATNISIQTMQNWASDFPQSYVTIQYTKTTD